MAEGSSSDEGAVVPNSPPITTVVTKSCPGAGDCHESPIGRLPASLTSRALPHSARLGAHAKPARKTCGIAELSEPYATNSAQRLRSMSPPSNCTTSARLV